MIGYYFYPLITQSSMNSSRNKNAISTHRNKDLLSKIGGGSHKINS